MITKYPDGSSYADVNGQQYARIVKRVNSYEDLWHLGQIIEAANHNGVKPYVYIPWLIDAQADRRFSKTQSNGLKMVCNFLNQFEVLEYKVFHPHNPDVLEAMLNKAVIQSNDKFISNVLRVQLNGLGCERPLLMSADAGGYKSLMKLCDNIYWDGETVSASKSRSYNHIDQKSTLTQIVPIDDFKGRDVLIVDDLCVYGGTFKGLASKLRHRNVGKLFLAVSHMSIQMHKDEDNIFSPPYFDKIFTTDSRFDTYYVRNSRNEPIKPSNLSIYNVL